MSSFSELRQLADRYPFSVDELEVLLRCHQTILDDSNKDSFVMKLAHSLPYSHFFLPGDEMRRRVDYIEEHVLPMGFSNDLRASISADSFVSYANQGQDIRFERFIEGIADTGRRGPQEALRIVYKILPEPFADELTGLCYRLAIANDILVSPNFDEKAVEKRIEVTDEAMKPLVHSLKENCGGDHIPNRADFVKWAENSAPILSSTMSTFVHNLIFPGMPFPRLRSPYEFPALDQSSDIFESHESPLLFPLSMMSLHFGGKMHRLYSSQSDGSSFNRLEWSLLGYGGPTMLIIQTDQDIVLGAFASMPWKDTDHFYGDSDNFVFQLVPNLRVFRATGNDDHFMYCHSASQAGTAVPDNHPHGLGFGGREEKPRLFLPESLEECTACFLDDTYEAGDLLPKEALEKFRIKYLEAWGVGGDEKITKAMRSRAEYRERTDTTILRARVVADKSAFAADMKSGLIPNKGFSHQEQVRGRGEFQVDDEHGGYKLQQT